MSAKKRLSGYWRVVFTLAAKDIVDAIKNKTTLTILLGLGMMMLSVEALPLLLQLDSRPRIAVYDADRTGVADRLRQDGVVQVVELRSAEAAAHAAREASQPLLAINLPAGWESGGGEVAVDGYVGHWVGGADAAALAAAATGALTAVTARPLTIETAIVYPTLTSGGQGVMLALGLVLVATMVTAILVPYLILEEKTTQTLALLRVSPVSGVQLILGKGVAGLVYGLVGVAVLLAFNLSWINLWGLLLPALLGIILFGVGLGLLVGLFVENVGAVQLWIGLFSMLLMFPLMVGFVDASRIPEWLRGLLAWLPTNAAFDLVRLSYGGAWLGAEIWPRLATIAAGVLLVYLAAVWRLQRWGVNGG